MAEQIRTEVDIYTDGGCDPNPGPGGWGAVLVAGLQTKELSGADPATTNNRMELTAAIRALASLRTPCRVSLYTDSQYLRRGITEWVAGWQAHGWLKANGRPVENVDLWQELVVQVGRHEMAWHWVRGHRGNPLNERADTLATAARRKLLAGELPIEGVGGASRRPRTKSAAAAATLPAYTLYARGCALGVPGPGGYAATLVPGAGAARTISGGWPLATANVMELWAVIAGLRGLRQRSQVTVCTRSKYVFEGATRWMADWERRNWHTRQGHPVKNREIWEELGKVMGDHDVRWQLEAAQEPAEASVRAATAARQEAERQAAAERQLAQR